MKKKARSAPEKPTLAFFHENVFSLHVTYKKLFDVLLLLLSSGLSFLHNRVALTIRVPDFPFETRY